MKKTMIAVAVAAASLALVTGCVVSNNASSTYGGGVNMHGGTLEKVWKKPANEVLREQVLIPAGISDEFYFVCDEDIFPRIATVYHGRYTEVMNSGWARKAMLPSSFAVASAHGIAKFYNRLCGFDGQPPLLKPETLEEALKVSVTCKPTLVDRAPQWATGSGRTA